VKRPAEKSPGNAFMRINGLSVDTQAIAEGLYDIICGKGEDSIVAFGMISKWIVDLTEKLVREKVIAETARQLNLTVEELKPYIDEKHLMETVQPIIHEICLGIYAAAAKAGKLLV
jgi:hypothetical protein